MLLEKIWEAWKYTTKWDPEKAYIPSLNWFTRSEWLFDETWKESLLTFFPFQCRVISSIPPVEFEFGRHLIEYLQDLYTAELWARFLLLTACYFYKIQVGVRKTYLGENKQQMLRHKILITFSTARKLNSMQLKKLIIFLVSYSKPDLMLHIQVWTGCFCWISLNKHWVSFEVTFESTQK